jgi:hypothetical protein
VLARGRTGLVPVLGFPKSGGTWLCGMLADALGLPFAQLPRVPAVRAAVVHAHWPHHARVRPAVFSLRDGRDTMVSFYFFCKLIHDAGEPSRFRRLYGAGADLDDVRTNLPRFIEHIFAHPMGTRQPWPAYNRAWIGRPGVVITRYETLRRDPENELARIVRQLGAPGDPARIRAAVEANSMQRLTGRRPGEEDRAAFIRKGSVGDWKHAFTVESCRVFADLAGDALVEFGYEKSPSWHAWDRTPSPAAYEDASGQGAHPPSSPSAPPSA